MTEQTLQAGVANADHMSEGSRMLAFLVMAFGMFMALIDIQIVASSLTEIQGGLAATGDEISSIQTSYLVAEVIMIPLSGWFSRIFSTRWLFTASAAGFTLASIACALAWNIQSMVVFRALQGFIGGAMIPTVFATGFVLFTGAAQIRIPAILGLVATLAPTLGPTVGGWITDHLSWRWLFFINVVPGVAVTLLVPALVKVDQPNLGLLKRMDLVGVSGLAAFLGCLQYVLEKGAKNDWLSDPTLAALSAVALAGFVVFIWRCFTASHPVVDLKAFRHRNFLMGCVFSFVVGIGLYGMVYLSPLFLGMIRGFDASQVGDTVWVVGLFQILATPTIVILSQRIDIRWILGAGFAMLVVSNWQFSHITADWGFAEMFWPQALRGLGLMFCIVPVTRIALAELAPEELKGASGLYNLMRNLGGAVGLAALNTELFYGRFSLHYDRLAESLTSARSAVGPVLAAADERYHVLTTSAIESVAAARGFLDRLVIQQAYLLSFADMFFMLAVIFSATLLLLPLVRYVAPGGPGTDSE